jgi:hypothetical protein
MLSAHSSSRLRRGRMMAPTWENALRAARDRQRDGGSLMQRVELRFLWALLLVPLLAAACGSTAAPSSPTTVTSPTDASVSAPPTSRPCPNPYGGGACLGPLLAGTYETSVFRTPISYTVPEGWANYEDEPGNFLLVPPGGSLDGVDAGTSDYVGIYMGVNIMSADCVVEGPEAGVGITAEAMAAALAERRGLLVTEPVPVEVGGLSGRLIDIAIDPASDAGCQIPELDEPLVLLIIGAGPASLAHAQWSGFTTRLYILDLPSSNIVIEISDVADAPGTTADYEGVVSGLVFTP